MKMREDLQQARENGETDFVPFLARHTKQDAVEYEERRPNPEAMTLNKLTHQRKVEKIEHNMNNFGWRTFEHPRYSNQEKAWWTMQDGYVPCPPPPLLKEVHEPTQEVTLKVTEVCPPPRAAIVIPGSQVQERPPSNKREHRGHEAVFDESHHRTLHRWTTEFVPQSVDKNEPRYFDGVKQAPTYSLDTAELDQFSSFDCIAKASIMEENSRQRKVAKEDEDRAHAWKLSMCGGPDNKDKSDDYDNILEDRFISTSRGPVLGASAQLSLSSRESGKRPPASARVTNGVSEVRRAPLRSFPPLPEPGGEDVPMTERLERIITGRKTGNAVVPSENTQASVSLLQKDSSSHSLNKTTKGGDRSLRVPMPPGRSSVVADPQSLVVRTGGFQWINSQTVKYAPSMMEDPSNSSLLKTGQVQDTSPRSRSGTMQAAPT